MNLQIWRDEVTCSLMFRGEIPGSDMVMLDLDKMDLALLRGISKGSHRRMPAADILLGLELLFRRHAEQNQPFQMNHTTMTDEQINEKIAFELGWRQLQDGRWKRNGRVERSTPNYCNDLNAMREAEQQLRNFDEWLVYDKFLAEIAEGFTWHATARQRAEAFLRTMNLWEE